MARRKKSSPAEDLIQLVVMLPWWAGVVLAGLSCLLLHQAAAQSLTTSAEPGQLSAMVTHGLWKGLASADQYILPIICLAAIGTSAWRRRVREILVTDVAQSQASDVFDGVSSREFEMLADQRFRLYGYQVVETGGGGADGGVDLVLPRPGSSGGRKFLVQGEQWRALNVGVDVVRELYGAMAPRGATGGFVVTSGQFTDDAISFASGRNVTLVGGPELVGLIRQARAGAGQPAAWMDAAKATGPTVESGQATACRLCAKPMVRRTAKRGANAGSEFWGCTGYPACRGTRPID